MRGATDTAGRWPGPEGGARFFNIILAATLVLIENKRTLVDRSRVRAGRYYRNALLQRTDDPEVVLLIRRAATAGDTTGQ